MSTQGRTADTSRSTCGRTLDERPFVCEEEGCDFANSPHGSTLLPVCLVKQQRGGGGVEETNQKLGPPLLDKSDDEDGGSVRWRWILESLMPNVRLTCKATHHLSLFLRTGLLRQHGRFFL